MKAITADTIDEFAPEYSGYARRRTLLAKQIGVESTNNFRDFRSAIAQWNRDSRIGWSAEEAEMISLILSEEEANIRFDGNKFIRPEFGGNTAEHPIFAGLKIDAQRDSAGYGPSHFDDLDLEHKLAAARLCQEQHSLIALHDLGELIDITVDEARALNASSKEPPEEKEVGPFKLRLAAYALAQGKPKLYISTMDRLRTVIRANKENLYSLALQGEMTGDEFVAKLGQEIHTLIAQTEAQYTLQQHTLGKYEEAATALSAQFDHTQELSGFSGALHTLFDKMEGDAHFRHFIGRMKEQPNKKTELYARMFQQGAALSYQMASSAQVMASLTYSQKTIPVVLHEAHQLPRGVEREVATNMARASSAALLRNHIRILQKSPPVLDTTKNDNRDAQQSDYPGTEPVEFKQRLDTVRGLKEDWVDKTTRLYARDSAAATRAPITQIQGVVDSKTLIAVLEKAACAIETGQWVPTAKDLPIGFGTLPPQLHVTLEDLRRTSRLYPLEASQDYYKQAGVRL